MWKTINTYYRDATRFHSVCCIPVRTTGVTHVLWSEMGRDQITLICLHVVWRRAFVHTSYLKIQRRVLSHEPVQFHALQVSTYCLHQRFLARRRACGRAALPVSHGARGGRGGTPSKRCGARTRCLSTLGLSSAAITRFEYSREPGLYLECLLQAFAAITLQTLSHILNKPN